MNDAVLLYRSFGDSMEDMTETEAAMFIYRIYRYGIDDIDPQFTGTEKAIFKVIQPVIDANNAKRQIGKAGGKFGGRPHKSDTKQDGLTHSKTHRVNPVGLSKEKGKEKEKEKVPPRTPPNERTNELAIVGLDIPNPEPPPPISDKAKSFAEWFIRTHDPRPQIETSAKAIRHVKSYEQLTGLGYIDGDILRAITYSMGGDCYYRNLPRTFKAHPIWSKAVRSPANLLEADATGTRKLDKVLAALVAEDKNDPISNGEHYF